MPAPNDSIILTVADSILSPDSLSGYVTQQFHGVGLPAEATGQNWIFAALLILLVFLVLAVNRSHSWMVDAIKNLSKIRSRGSLFVKTSVHEYQSRWLLIIFSTGVVCLFYFLNSMDKGSFQLLLFLIGTAMVLIWILVKAFLIRIIGYVFMSPESLKIAKDNYYNVYSMLGFLLFPLLFINIYTQLDWLHLASQHTAIILAFIALIFITIKLFQIFYIKILDFFYIMLYLCTLEILPLIGIKELFEFIALGFLT